MAEPSKRSSRRWRRTGGDDPGSERGPSLAGEWPHGYAQGLRRPGGAGEETLKRNPHNGHLFVFRGRRGGLIKVLWHDGQGLCLFAKRLERGRFVWPATVPKDGEARTVAITAAQLGYLLEGIDWRLPQNTWRPQAAG